MRQPQGWTLNVPSLQQNPQFHKFRKSFHCLREFFFCATKSDTKMRRHFKTITRSQQHSAFGQAFHKDRVNSHRSLTRETLSSRRLVLSIRADSIDQQKICPEPQDWIWSRPEPGHRFCRDGEWQSRPVFRTRRNWKQ